MAEAMTHQTPNPHDAEETIRPLLGDLFEAKLQYGSQVEPITWQTADYVRSQQDLIDECFKMLGIQHLSV